MLQGNLPRIVELVRRLHGPPSGDDELELCDFLRRLKEHRLPNVIAAALAWAIAESGTLIPTKRFAPISSIHSTGAPGSLSTLLAPVLVAACGVYVPLVSVRGSVAGAIDSLATLPGYDVSLNAEAFLRILEATKLAHVSHSEQIAPADRVLWELRGRLDAKEEPCLIAASLLGKKLAVGAVCGSIDVRVGAAGNAGTTTEAAFETAWAIVGAAQALGMRVSCVLSDATHLAWGHLGRIDSLLSVWNVLTDPTVRGHPHVKLCKEIAAVAGHAASPLLPLEQWRDRVTQALESGEAQKVFEASTAAHGATRAGLDELRRQAEERQRVEMRYEAEPDPGSVSAFFKAIRARARPEVRDAIGVEWSAEKRGVAVLVPREAGLEAQTIRELFAAVQPVRPGTERVAPHLLLFDGSILSASR